MDRRTILAIGLMLIVAILPSLLRKPRVAPAGAPSGPDTGTVVVPTDSLPAPAPEPAPVREPRVVAEPTVVVPDTAPGEVVAVESPLYRYEFSARGARLVGATLKNYRSLPGDSVLVQLIPEESHFLEYELLFGNDTVSLAGWTFEPSQSALSVGAGANQLQWVAHRGSAEVRITQTFRPDSYLFDVTGEFSGIVADAGLVLVRLGPSIRSVEADSVWNYRSYAVVTKARSTERTDFSDVDPGDRRIKELQDRYLNDPHRLQQELSLLYRERRAELAGPFEWVALKSRYFLSVVLSVEEGTPRIGGAVVTGRPRSGRFATEADVLMSLPAPGGRFRHAVYVGPQEFDQLARIGHSLEDVNPYGWVFRPIIRPFANFIVRILLWMHETMRLGYGWVLILFGIAVRLVLWPLNQRAMRSQMAMQALQPEIKVIQDRYKQDPQRLQQEMMKLYREHKVNPLGGCLPLMLPMPVLFALFFVFRETIEFRGEPFLWLPDLSRADPLYIIPIAMGLSMYGVSKIGQRGLPPNPQAKIMLYFFPVMLTVLFLRFAAGLNLYYAVSNIASIPQQWLIARERLRRAGRPAAKPKPKGG